MSISGQLSTLESSGLIRLLQTQPELEYLFRHTLVQEAAYDSLVKTDRRALHLAAGQALERLYPDRCDSRELAHLLARHFYEAGDAERALRYFTVAGDAAAQVYANEEAVGHYTQALALATSAKTPSEDHDQLLHLFAQRGRSLELLGRFEAAEQNYRDLEDLARRLGDEHLELEGLVRRTTLLAVPTARMDMEQGLELGQQALQLARRLGDHAAEAHSLWNLSNASKFAGRPEQSVEYGDRAIAVAREHGLREQLGLLLNDVYPAYWSLGQVERAAAAVEEAQRLLREAGNLPLLADCLTNTGQLYLYKGEPERGRLPLAEALEISRAIANQWGQAFALWTTAQLDAEMGQMGAAIHEFEECIPLADEAGFLIGRIMARAALSQLLGLLGDVDQGLALAQGALARADEGLPNFPMARAAPLATLARLQVYRGDVGQAAELMAVATHEAGESLNELTPMLALIKADVRLAQGDYQSALEGATEGLALVTNFEMRVSMPDFMSMLGRARLGLGQLPEAREALENGRDQAREMGLARVLWQILAALYRLERQSGDEARAEAARREARDMIRAISDSLPTADWREKFQAVPDVRDIIMPDLE